MVDACIFQIFIMVEVFIKLGCFHSLVPVQELFTFIDLVSDALSLSFLTMVLQNICSDLHQTEQLNGVLIKKLLCREKCLKGLQDLINVV